MSDPNPWRSEPGMRQVQETAAGEYVRAWDAQRRIDELGDQIRRLQAERDQFITTRNGYLRVVRELRFGAEEMVKCADWLHLHGGPWIEAVVKFRQWAPFDKDYEDGTRDDYRPAFDAVATARRVYAALGEAFAEHAVMPDDTS